MHILTSFIYSLCCFTLFFLLSIQYALADQALDSLSLNNCLAESTNKQDQTNLVKWIAVSMSSHPEIAEIAHISPKDKSHIEKIAGHIFNRLLTTDCKEEMGSLLKYSTDIALNESIINFVKHAQKTYLSNQHFRESLEKSLKCDSCIEMVKIPGALYMIGKYEVTQAEWKKVMWHDPSFYKDCGEKCPVENITWNQIHSFIDKLNAKTGLNYRLPTQQEWETACQAGAKPPTKYCGSNLINEVAWYKLNSDGKSHPVGQKIPNAWGIYDMTGNVWEQTKDNHCVKLFKDKEPFCHDHIIRGGSFNDTANFSKALNTGMSVDVATIEEFGFRLVLDLSNTNLQ